MNTPSGDCDEFNAEYPGCITWEPESVGNGQCDKDSNNAQCKYDGGKHFGKLFCSLSLYVLNEKYIISFLLYRHA